jgi:hypothetical protein
MHSKTMALLQLAMALALPALTAAAAAAPVAPPWGYTPTTQGAACVDASLDHDPFTENNTRWSFFALPEGTPPAAGWPLYVDFLAQPYAASAPQYFPGGELPGQCGNGWLDPDGGCSQGR